MKIGPDSPTKLGKFDLKVSTINTLCGYLSDILVFFLLKNYLPLFHRYDAMAVDLHRFRLVHFVQQLSTSFNGDHLLSSANYFYLLFDRILMGMLMR